MKLSAFELKAIATKLEDIQKIGIRVDNFYVCGIRVEVDVASDGRNGSDYYVTAIKKVE